jgi:peptidoglycan/LPS O-acetylase OafA/YrhL
LAERVRTLVIVGLAVLPPIVLFAMNSLAWGTDLDAVALAYRLVIYVGLLMALASIALAIRQLRRGGSYTVFGIALVIALGFIVWVGPDAYLDLAAAVSGP